MWVPITGSSVCGVRSTGAMADRDRVGDQIAPPPGSPIPQREDHWRGRRARSAVLRPSGFGVDQGAVERLLGGYEFSSLEPAPTRVEVLARSRCMTSSALRSMTSSSGTSPGGYNSSSSPGTLLAGPGMRVLEAFWRRDEGGSLTEAATKPGPPPALEHIGVVLSFVTFGSRSGPAMDNRSACGRRLDGGRGADGSGLADLSGGPCGGLLAGALALAPGGVVAARAAGRGGHWALGGGVDGWANRTGSWPRSRQVTLAAGWTPLRKVGRCWARLPGCHDGCSRTLAGPAARPGVATPLSSPGEPGTGRLLAYLEVGQR